jgi:hypothetical protein
VYAPSPSSNHLPALDATRTLGFTAVTTPFKGLYCLTPAAGLNFDNRPTVASVDVPATVGAGDAVVATSPRYYCPAGSVEVMTFKPGEIVPQQADNVSFSVIVP